jgi:hypothetical protein
MLETEGGFAVSEFAVKRSCATMGRVLEKLTVESFAGEIGKSFRLTQADAPAIDLVLVEARGLSAGSRPPGGRAPFSLVFLGPMAPVLPQRIYPLESPSLGRLEIFLVPIATDAGGVKYEAVFN